MWDADGCGRLRGLDVMLLRQGKGYTVRVSSSAARLSGQSLLLG